MLAGISPCRELKAVQIVNSFQISRPVTGRSFSIAPTINECREEGDSYAEAFIYTDDEAPECEGEDIIYY